jgi:hypothetical protein
MKRALTLMEMLVVTVSRHKGTLKTDSRENANKR